MPTNALPLSIELPDYREYKMMLRPNLFDEKKSSMQSFQKGLERNLKSHKASLSGTEFQRSKRQRIEVLDTKDFQIRNLGLLLRKRTRVTAASRKAIEMTLKCRSPDLCIAIGHHCPIPQNFSTKSKLEEDVATPFVSRFSRSTTVTLSSAPRTTEEITAIFSCLRSIEGLPKYLKRVNDLQITEDVFEGPVFKFGEVSAKVAVILWFIPKRKKPVAAEFSFRVPFNDVMDHPDTAKQILGFYETMQGTKWMSSEFGTKTSFIYES